MPYQSGDWLTLTRAQKAPMIVHFWGVTCGPCMTEMPQWGHFAAQHQENVVFIEIDPAPMKNVMNLIHKLQTQAYRNYYVDSVFDERSRYEIDPKWQGETPYTILVGTKGAQTSFSGSADFKQLASWIKNNP